MTHRVRVQAEELVVHAIAKARQSVAYWRGDTLARAASRRSGDSRGGGEQRAPMFDTGVAPGERIVHEWIEMLPRGAVEMIVAGVGHIAKFCHQSMDSGIAYLTASNWTSASHSEITHSGSYSLQIQDSVFNRRSLGPQRGDCAHGRRQGRQVVMADMNGRSRRRDGAGARRQRALHPLRHHPRRGRRSRHTRCAGQFWPDRRTGELRRRRPAEKVVGREGPHRLESFAKVVSINLIGTFNMLRLAAMRWSATSRTPVENGVSSSIPPRSRPSMADRTGRLCLFQGAVVALTLPVARELARSGIRVMTIAPGIMEPRC